METDPTRMCELLVGLLEVRVLAVEDRCGEPIRVHVEQLGDRPGWLGCGKAAKVKDRDVVDLVDLPALPRPARLMWHKVRWCCPDPDCEMRSWTWADPRIATSRAAMTDRAGRWATEQVGRYARSVNEIAEELGCDCHRVVCAVVCKMGSGMKSEHSDYATWDTDREMAPSRRFMERYGWSSIHCL